MGTIDVPTLDALSPLASSRTGGRYRRVTMDQLRKVLLREVQTVRINSAYTQPEMATDMLVLFQRGRDSAREAEPELRTLLI
jgi:hypothetical protein